MSTEGISISGLFSFLLLRVKAEQPAQGNSKQPHLSINSGDHKRFQEIQNDIVEDSKHLRSICHSALTAILSESDIASLVEFIFHGQCRLARTHLCVRRECVVGISSKAHRRPRLEDACFEIANLSLQMKHLSDITPPGGKSVVYIRTCPNLTLFDSDTNRGSDTQTAREKCSSG